MSETLVITGRPAFADQISYAELPTDVLQLRDQLYPGPAPFVRSAQELSRVRAKFLSAQVPEHYGRWWQTHLDEQDAVFEQVGRRYGKVHLWFGHSAIEQLQLSHCIARLAPLVEQGLVSLQAPNCNIGFRQHTSEEIRQCFALTREISAEQLALGQRFWQAFSDRTPRQLAELACANTTAMPFLKAATCRLLEELPAISNGLRRHEELLLLALGEHQSLSVESLLAHCLENDDESLSSETHVFAQLEALATPPIQLIEGLTIKDYSQLDSDRLDDYQKQQLRLTPAAKALLEQEFPLSRFRQHQFWLGGTFIHVGNMWYWDSKTSVLSGPHRRGHFLQQIDRSLQKTRSERYAQRLGQQLHPEATQPPPATASAATSHSH